MHPMDAIETQGLKYMTRKSKSLKKNDTKQIPENSKYEDELNVARASNILNPSVQAAVTIRKYDNVLGDLDFSALMTSLSEETRETSSGNMKRADVMLTSQAHTLDAIFNCLARNAALNMGKHMHAFEAYLKLALRAQSQSRATWEALSAIKNPPVMGYVRQANIAHGPQQVNNASKTPDDAPRAGKNQNVKNKLMEENNGEWVDTGTASTPSQVDSTMAAVGKINRAKNRGR